MLTETWTSIRQYVPIRLQRALDDVPAMYMHTASELRLRADAPVCLSLPSGEYALSVILSFEEIQGCFWKLCGQAVHTHEAELRYGFIITQEGIRVGVGGTAIIKQHEVTGYRDITSLCIRIARVKSGCATSLLPYLRDDGAVQGLLICGAPGSGKTTLLRDIAAMLSQTHRVAVADERLELRCDMLSRCDVIGGCPKATAILQAVRTLAPDLIIADELGDIAEWRAVEKSLYCGVPLIASAHIGHEQQARKRRELMAILQKSGFSYLVFLPSPRHSDEPTRVWKARDFLEDRRDRVGYVFLRGGGVCVGTAAV